MGTANWIYDAILYIYALSLMFYFSDFLNASRRAKRTGTGLLIFVWVLQTGYLASGIVMRLEVDNLAGIQYWLGFTWLLITVSLIINRFFYINFIVFFVNVIGFAVLALNLYGNLGDDRSLNVWQTTRELLYVHISLAIGAYVALTFGALFAGMYLFLHNRLKTKRWSKFIHRYPSLDTIERYADRSVAIGVPLLAMSIAIAITSLLVEGRESLLFDWKVISSSISLVIFIIYVYQRAANKRPGRQLAKLLLASFAMLLVNLLVNSFSAFH